MTARNQLTQAEARKLFDYVGGTLFWRSKASGQRSDGRAITQASYRGKDRTIIKISGKEYLGQYVVWNWHHGQTRNVICFRDGDRHNVAIENLFEAAEFIVAPSLSDRCTCPTCKSHLPVPVPLAVAITHDLAPMERAILLAVWEGKGLPVQTSKIFDAMYADDPDGGPTPSEMYKAFKVSMSRLRGKLRGSGVGIDNVGYAQGYRLVLMQGTGG